jgi:hypothetical protein
MAQPPLSAKVILWLKISSPTANAQTAPKFPAFGNNTLAIQPLFSFFCLFIVAL